jgi:hypothetical protein
MKGREPAIRLQSVYQPEWKDYSDVGGARGQFRYFQLTISKPKHSLQETAVG